MKRSNPPLKTGPIRKLDLTYIVQQLSSKPEFAGWSAERFNKAVEEYKEFLALCQSHPHEDLSPTVDADEIWHRHMLNSMQYMEDCERIFGYYLHHVPLPPGESTKNVAKCGKSRPCRTCRPTKAPVHASA